MLLILVSFSLFAGELDDKNVTDEKESVNFCLDKQSAIDNKVFDCHKNARGKTSRGQPT
jgi:hypothetical protein